MQLSMFIYTLEWAFFCNSMVLVSHNLNPTSIMWNHAHPWSVAVHVTLQLLFLSAQKHLWENCRQSVLLFALGGV